MSLHRICCCNVTPPGTNGIIYALRVWNSRLYVGGNYSVAGSITANNIASWDGSTWATLGATVTGGGTSGSSPSVRSLAEFNSRLIVGGSFDSVDGTACNHIGDWDGSAWDTQYASIAISPVLAVAESTGASLLTAGGGTSSNFAQYFSTVWTPMRSTGPNGNSNAQVNALLDVSGTIYAACGVSSTGYLFSTTWNTGLGGFFNNWTTHGTLNNVANAIAVYDSGLAVGGVFTSTSDGAAARVAKWNGSAYSAIGGGIDNGIVNALAVYGGDLYAGGTFTSVEGGTAAASIARFNGTAWVPVGSGVSGGVAAVQSLAVYGGSLYAGGNFTTAGGVSAPNIARWNGSAWSAV
jgi:trimeric autotransporter adhesin